MGARWRIYYDDGSTFGYLDGDPADAPAFGVIAILQDPELDDEQAGRHNVVSKSDWYFWEPERLEWWGCDLHGLLDRLLHRLPTAAVLQGRSVSTARWREIILRATKGEPL